MKHVVILGATGSIGEQAINILSQYPDQFEITGLSAEGNRIDRLIHLAQKAHPRVIHVANAESADALRDRLSGTGTVILSGSSEQLELSRGQRCETCIVLSAISGTSGLIPTMAAIEAGLDVAIANKETFVTCGQLVADAAERSGSRIFPVDSEHSAILQCLQGVQHSEVSRLILTCSGGPFRDQPDRDLSLITPADALAHPTWDMGRKITIDSATLMNKGLEVIEARWLFGISHHHIDVVVHPESIIHSMIETRDGSVMAQMSKPDMRLPILYAMTGGEHWTTSLPRIDFTSLSRLTFHPPDTSRFPCLNLAYQALNCGGTMPAVLNAANEIAVDAFCSGSIHFTDIPHVILSVMEQHTPLDHYGLGEILQVDTWAKHATRTVLKI